MSEPRATDHRFALRHNRFYSWSPGANSGKRQEFVPERVTCGLHLHCDLSSNEQSSFKRASSAVSSWSSTEPFLVDRNH